MRNSPNCLTAMALAVSLFLISFANAEAAATRPNSSAAPGQDRSYEFGQQAVEKEDWAEAVEHLSRAVKRNARSADAFNLLAYSYRRMGNLDLAFRNYEKALSLDPRHRGAHEYVGEAYLTIGEPEKAKEHLAILREICGDDCEETVELREVIARYRERGDSQPATEAGGDPW